MSDSTQPEGSRMLNTPLSDRDLLIEIHTKVKALVGTDSDHEARIRKLEKFMYSATAIAAAIGSAVGAYVGQLPH